MSSDLGTMLVKLGIDPSGLVTGESAAMGSFGRIESGMKNLAMGFVGLGAAFELGGFLKNGIRDAIEEEAAMARLTAALHANVPAWDGTLEAIKRQVNAAMDLGFADTEAEGSLAQLAAATHSVSGAIDLQNTAMDLARLKHISLEEASSALIRIEAGRFKGLADLGIVLEKGATQEQALAAVRAVAAGQAKAFGSTLEGGMKEAETAISEAGQVLGDALIPYLRTGADIAKNVLAPAISTIAGGMTTLTPLVDGVAVLIGVKLVGSLTGAAAGFLNLGAAATTAGAEAAAGAQGVETFSSALKGLPIILIATELAQLVQRIGQIGTILGEFSSNDVVRTQSAMQTLTDQFGVNAETIGPLGDQYRALKAHLAEITSALQSTTNGLGSGVPPMMAYASAAATAAAAVTGAGNAESRAATDAAKLTAAKVALKSAQDAAAKAGGADVLANDAVAAAQRDVDLATNQLRVDTMNLQNTWIGTSTLGPVLVSVLQGVGSAARDAADGFNVEATGTLNAAAGFATLAAAEAAWNRGKKITAQDAFESGLKGADSSTFGPGGMSAADYYLSQLGNGIQTVTPHAKALKTSIDPDISGAINAAKSAGDDWLNTIHQGIIQAINDEHDHATAIAQTTYQADLAANHAKANAEKDSLTAKQAKEQFDRLSQAVSDAQNALAIAQSGGNLVDIAKAQANVAGAQTALTDFELQQQINADEKQAGQDDKAAKDRYDAAVNAANEQQTSDTDTENTRAAKQKKAFDAALGDIERHLKAKKGTIAQAERDIIDLLLSYGIEYSKAGTKNAGDWIAGLADGLQAAGGKGGSTGRSGLAAGGSAGFASKIVEGVVVGGDSGAGRALSASDFAAVVERMLRGMDAFGEWLLQAARNGIPAVLNMDSIEMGHHLDKSLGRVITMLQPGEY